MGLERVYKSQVLGASHWPIFGWKPFNVTTMLPAEYLPVPPNNAIQFTRPFLARDLYPFTPWLSLAVAPRGQVHVFGQLLLLRSS